VPVKNVTNCIFTGANLDTLFITTARQGHSTEYSNKKPIAGGVFAIALSVKGIEDNKFIN
jgi:D-xylonolactonase